MKISHVTICTKNLEESIRFYTEVLGCAVKRRFQGGPNEEICFVNADSVDIELIGGLSEGINYDPNPRVSIGFPVDDLDAKHEYIKTKATDVTDIVSPNPHVRFFFFNDPNGVRLQFITEGDMSASR
jgi:lactoylglutathione lyase